MREGGAASNAGASARSRCADVTREDFESANHSFTTAGAAPCVRHAIRIRALRRTSAPCAQPMMPSALLRMRSPCAGAVSIDSG